MISRLLNAALFFIVIMGFLSCSNESVSKMDLNSSDDALTEDFEKWFEKTYPSTLSCEVINAVSASNAYPLQLHSSLTKLGSYGSACRDDDRPEWRREYRENGQGWYKPYISDLQNTQNTIKETYKKLKDEQTGTDSTVVCYTVRLVKNNTIEAPVTGRFIAIYSGNAKSSLVVAPLDKKLLRSIGAVDLALQDSLILGDMDYERLHREATNPVMKAIYAPLPQAN